MNRRVVGRWAAAALAAGCACTFNVEETVQTFGWTRDFSGVRSVALDQTAFGGCGLQVTGVEAERLALSCDLRRLVSVGSRPPQDIQLRVSREDDSVTLTLAVSGENWVTVAVDSIRMELGRWFSLDLGEIQGGIEVLNYGAFVSGRTRNGSVTVQTEVGADVVTNDGGVTVTVMSDSVFRGIDVVTRNGDISVRVPAALDARLELTTRRGTIRVCGRRISGHEYTSPRGVARATIRCETIGGDIGVDTLPAT